MKNQVTKNPMKTISFWKCILILTAMLAVFFPMFGKAGTLVGKAELIGKASPLVGQKCLKLTNRPLSNFLDTQGTLNDPPQFFMPVKDYVGWANNPQVTFALVDYAGLANKYIKAQTGHSLNTNVSGFVIECKLPDGKAQITVTIFTTGALGFAQSINEITNNGFDFLNTPTIFGAKAHDVVKGMKPAIGPVSLVTTFSISAPGADLPDFLDVINNSAKYAPVKLSFTSTTFGSCPDGTKARLDVHQVASTNVLKELDFSIEKVAVVDNHGGNCGGKENVGEKQ